MKLTMSGDNEFWTPEGENIFTGWSVSVIYDTTKMESLGGTDHLGGSDAVLSVRAYFEFPDRPTYDRTFGPGEVKWFGRTRNDPFYGDYYYIEAGEFVTTTRLYCGDFPDDLEASYFSGYCYQFASFSIPGAQDVHVHYESVSRVDDPGSVVPEPTTWALMILGFGVAGSAARRRRRVDA
ncbi:MAG: hypothetical protein DI570_11415 [Phenylobacterium zucineum]|nr:MAG: hypothetical protein DI570_11415 [Phenylobacterium zucineum]